MFCLASILSSRIIRFALYSTSKPSLLLSNLLLGLRNRKMHPVLIGAMLGRSCASVTTLIRKIMLFLRYLTCYKTEVAPDELRWRPRLTGPLSATLRHLLHGKACVWCQAFLLLHLLRLTFFRGTDRTHTLRDSFWEEQYMSPCSETVPVLNLALRSISPVVQEMDRLQ